MGNAKAQSCWRTVSLVCCFSMLTLPYSSAWAGDHSLGRPHLLKRIDQLEKEKEILGQRMREISGELAQLHMDQGEKTMGQGRSIQPYSRDPLPFKYPPHTPQEEATREAASLSSQESDFSLIDAGTSESDGTESDEKDAVGDLIQEKSIESSGIKHEHEERQEQSDHENDLSSLKDNDARPEDASDDRREFLKARSLVADGKYLDAAQKFEMFIKSYPTSFHLPNASYWLAECYSSMDNWPAAARSYGDVYLYSKACLKNTPNKAKEALAESKVASSMIKLASILEHRLKKREEACITLKTLKKEIDLHPAQKERVNELFESFKCMATSLQSK